jgi:hypothetical protein
MAFDRRELLLIQQADERGLWPSCHRWESDSQHTLAALEPEADLGSTQGLWIGGGAEMKKRWQASIARATSVRYLRAKMHINQPMFDSICTLPDLRRLDIARSSVANINGLRSLRSFTHFWLGASPALKSIAPLANLSALRSLGFHGSFRNISDLEPLAGLTSLEGLVLAGPDTKIQRYESFRPLEALGKLRLFDTWSVRVRSGGLLPLRKLQTLEYLSLPALQLRFWPKKEFQALHEALPNLKNDVVRLAATDAEFQRQYGIK